MRTTGLIAVFLLGFAGFLYLGWPEPAAETAPETSAEASAVSVPVAAPTAVAVVPAAAIEQPALASEPEPQSARIATPEATPAMTFNPEVNWYSRMEDLLIFLNLSDTEAQQLTAYLETLPLDARNRELAELAQGIDAEAITDYESFH